MATLNSEVKVAKAFGGGAAIATSEEWQATTKVFPAGMFTLESDTKLLKITDGVNTYENIDYVLDFGGITTYPLLYHFYHDTDIINPSFVSSEEWSYHSGAIFVAVWELLNEEYSAAETVDASETIAGITINYKLTPKGFKIVTSASADIVQQIYNATGTAWYYILDLNNGYFKLPRNSGFQMGRTYDVQSGTYTELKMASGSGQTVKAVRQKLYFFMGNSIQNEAKVDIAGVTSSISNLATRIGSLESVDPVDTSSFMKITGGSFTGGVFENIVALSGNAINCAQGNYFSKTVTANITFSLTGVPSGKGACISLVLTNGGNFTVTWPTNLKWAEGTPPELTSNGTDVLTFMTIDGGTTWYGSLSITAAA